MRRASAGLARQRPVRLLALALGLGLSACSTSYRTWRMEFDSLSGLSAVVPEPQGVGEPAALEFSGQAIRWPWLVRNSEGSWFLFDLMLVATLGLEPSWRDVDNPSGRMRRSLRGMLDKSDDRLDRLIELTWRVSWLLQYDSQELDRIQALTAAEELLGRLGGDPLAAPLPAQDPAVQVARERREQQALLRWVAAGAPEPATDADRAALLRHIQYLAARPSPAAAGAIGRRSLRLLVAAAAATPDRELELAARLAVADRARIELAYLMRYELFDPAPEVREAAILALRRQAGDAAVPYALRWLGRPQSGSRYDPDAGLRRTLVRLASQLGPEQLYASHAGGPRPIEFLYDTATRDAEEGLQMVALDALSRALGRPVDLEPEWADTFWRTESLYRASGSTDRQSPPRPTRR